jgi:hypothetical protein
MRICANAFTRKTTLRVNFTKGTKDFCAFLAAGRQGKGCALPASLFNPQLYKIHDSISTKICFGRAPMLFSIYSRSWRGIEVIWGPYHPPIHGFNRTRQLVLAQNIFFFPQKWSARAGSPVFLLAAWPLGAGSPETHLPQRFCTEFAGPARAGEEGNRTYNAPDGRGK